MAERILNGWKEISSHLERGVRTAQRWERQFGMPVHRPASKQRTAVVAFAHELDAWLIRSQSRLNAARDEDEDNMSDPARLREALSRLQSEAQQLAARLWYLERNLNGTAIRSAESPEILTDPPWPKSQDRAPLRRGILRDAARAS